MNNIIEKEIQDLKDSLPRLPDLNNEYLFSLVCLKYFYNNGRLDYADYKDSFVDGKNDGGIDLITINEDISGQTSLILIQSKCISSLNNKQDVVDIFTKMDQTVRNFQEYRTAKYNKRLKRIFKEKLDFIEDFDSNIELVLFLNIDLINQRCEEIRYLIENIDELKKYQLITYYKNEIEQQINNINEPRNYVQEEKIYFAEKDGILKYRENGILVNISANSLRDLYDKYRDRGLFEQNFRYYIRNKKIDDNIIKSLSKKRNNFWFLNNGIIIGCSDFYPKLDYIKLYDFSIINGCQTATLIGEYKGKNESVDFYIPCKIIKPEGKDSEKFQQFISDIAEASNSQKPISDRDLKSNSPEQRLLQKMLKEDYPKIYLEIKRGQKVSKANIELWQKVKNDLLGQLILSFNLQQPGTARSGKRKIFSVNKIYEQVFKRRHDKNNIIDLLKLHNYYKNYINKQIKNNQFTDLNQESVASNGRFIILAIIGFFIKNKRKLLNLNNYSKQENWEMELIKDNLNGSIFNKNYTKDDFDDKLEALFSVIINELSNLYSTREQEEKTVSNFFKTDNKYRNIVQKHLIQRIYQNPYHRKELEQYLEIFD